MVYSVVKSERAEKVNLLIIATFIKIRELIYLHKDVVRELEGVKEKLTEHDSQISIILEHLKHMDKARKEKPDQKNRPMIGFKP